MSWLHLSFEKAGCMQITGFICGNAPVHTLLPVQSVSTLHAKRGSFSFAFNGILLFFTCRYCWSDNFFHNNGHIKEVAFLKFSVIVCNIIFCHAIIFVLTSSLRLPMIAMFWRPPYSGDWQFTLIMCDGLETSFDNTTWRSVLDALVSKGSFCSPKLWFSMSVI